MGRGPKLVRVKWAILGVKKNKTKIAHRLYLVRLHLESRLTFLINGKYLDDLA